MSYLPSPSITTNVLDQHHQFRCTRPGTETAPSPNVDDRSDRSRCGVAGFAGGLVGANFQQDAAPVIIEQARADPCDHGPAGIGNGDTRHRSGWR